MTKILYNERGRILCVTVGGTDYYRGFDMPARHLITSAAVTFALAAVGGIAAVLIITTLLNGIRFIFDLSWSWMMMYVGSPAGILVFVKSIAPVMLFLFKNKDTAEADVPKAAAARFAKTFVDAFAKASASKAKTPLN